MASLDPPVTLADEANREICELLSQTEVEDFYWQHLIDIQSNDSETADSTADHGAKSAGDLPNGRCSNPSPNQLSVPKADGAEGCLAMYQHRPSHDSQSSESSTSTRSSENSSASNGSADETTMNLTINETIRDRLKSLWTDSGIQAAYRRSDEYQLIDSGK